MQKLPVADLTGRKFFIAGGTGFVGRTLLDYLALSSKQHGPMFSVHVLSRDPSLFLDLYPEYKAYEWLHFVEGDLFDFDHTFLSGTELIHAASTPAPNDGLLNWLRATTLGTAAILEAAVAKGVQRILYFSSGAVYGDQRYGVRAQESDCCRAFPLDLKSSYASAKRYAETLCAAYGQEHKTSIIVARCYAIFGRHTPLNGSYAAGNFIRDALDPNVDAIRVNGSGDAVRTYIGDYDLGNWSFELLTRGIAGEAYNLGGEAEITILELATLIRDELAPEKKIIVADKTSVGSRSYYVPDLKKSKSLGLTITEDVPSCIRRVSNKIAENNEF